MNIFYGAVTAKPSICEVLAFTASIRDLASIWKYLHVTVFDVTCDNTGQLADFSYVTVALDFKDASPILSSGKFEISRGAVAETSFT